MVIKIVLAKAHENQKNNPEVQRELSDIQTFFVEKEFDFELNSLNFVILRGLYAHVDRMLTVVGVFVNKTEKTINGLKTELAFRVNDNPEAKLSGVRLDLPESFLGELKPNEGFVLHIKVMTKGLTKEKEIFQATELSGELRNIELAYQK
ncbi:hypothetical protein [Sporosarcina pasteurii]|uniref:Uncharacterized protein n=1 Tax=Sporosarcina pasteurii TaxID=1474 RepID=A0A380BFF1_SPOPA|nr:hypothetical protein [Sporosarcina pasteurii]MDS9472569.1 hypothetical protein [Sporosarcina pasteurii]QBQ06122.1 hypothetical protein E2C16_10760 [Sporosarcina pasteurii]SUI99386.1 Uncharacterised protein [Sporosarcina pasteurii]